MARGLSRQHLADKAKISLSTLEKALTGTRPFTLASVVRIEEALQLQLRKHRHMHNGDMDLAPESLGSYSHPAVSWLEGDYLTRRPSFSDAQSAHAYRTEIRWDKALPSSSASRTASMRPSSRMARPRCRISPATSIWSPTDGPVPPHHFHLISGAKCLACSAPCNRAGNWVDPRVYPIVFVPVNFK
jgi:transcriptional regulator with XRE-family HTH domain